MKLIIVFHSLLFLSLFASCQNRGDNWTHFRGTGMDGHATVEKAPLHWTETENIVWKTPVKGLGWSSPVVFDNQVWLTSAEEDGTRFYVFCFDLKTGELLYENNIFSSEEPQHIHSTNSYATPTPCIEENRVFVHYGHFGTACIDTKNFHEIWKRNDLPCEHMQGPASSPIIYKDLLIVHLEGTEDPYVVALNKYTGETIWKSVRPAGIYDSLEPVYRKSYQTPIVVQVNGRDLLISNSSFMCFAHDVNTGEVVWTFKYGYDSTISQPLFWNGLVFVNSGWIFEDNKPYFTRQFAIDPKGEGDITETNQVWMYEDEVPQIPTPLIVDGLMYMVHDRGTVTCLDAMTARVIWKENLKGNFNSSPIYAAGNIYFFSVKGDCTIIKPGNSFLKVAENSIGETVKATPVFVRDQMILRTDKNLYLIK
jgi:outer membrane protein assembly factor BamB